MKIIFRIRKRHLNFLIAILLIVFTVVTVKGIDETRGWHDASQIRLTPTEDLVTSNNMILLKNIEENGQSVTSYAEGRLNKELLPDLSVSIQTASGSGTITVTCPLNTIAVGGGFRNIPSTGSYLSAYKSTVNDRQFICYSSVSTVFECQAYCISYG